MAVIGTVVTAVCIFMERTGASKKDIYNYAKNSYPADSYPYSVDQKIGGGIAEEFYGGTGFDEDCLFKKYLDEELYRIVNM